MKFVAPTRSEQLRHPGGRNGLPFLETGGPDAERGGESSAWGVPNVTFPDESPAFTGVSGIRTAPGAALVAQSPALADQSLTLVAPALAFVGRSDVCVGKFPSPLGLLLSGGAKQTTKLAATTGARPRQHINP